MSTLSRRSLDRAGVEALARELAPPPPDPAIRDVVAGILADVRRDGDDALVAQTRRFDAAEFTAADLRVTPEALAAAAAALPATLLDAILTAAAQVRAVAEATRPSDQHVTAPLGQSITVRALPVAAAGLYVPGGRAAYPSSLVMAAVPAQVAGVERIAVVTPPGPGGRPHQVIMATAALLGLDEVFAVGGAASIAALAYGTAAIAPVAVIAGPGSAWVQEAKRQVFGRVGIDSVAGPSEIVVVADAEAHPGEVAADLLAQSEHGPDSPAILVSSDRALVDAVHDALTQAGAVGALTLIDCADLDVALAFAEAFAPEHLQLHVRDAATVATRVRHAGAVFVGQNGATAFGDYIAGSNHILPTGGAARFASAVSAATFMRRMSVVAFPDTAVTKMTPHLAAIADAEGFTNHRRSAEMRAARIAGQGEAQ